MGYRAGMNHAMIDLPVRRLGLGEPGDAELTRSVAVEAPVSVEVGGIGYAVMMATPADLEDYAVGFALSEGLVATADQISRIDAHAIEGGWALRIWLPPVTARIATDRTAIANALMALPDHQPLGRATGAAHAAAFCSPAGAIELAREDVGRHNALDKLIGAMARAGIDPASGFILLSARCSYELVEKTVRAGCPMLVTISAPTSLAVERAADAGLTLVALARTDAALIVGDPHGMIA